MSREDMRKRDERIIQLLGYGLKPTQIAERMGIAPRTVTDAKYRNAQAGAQRYYKPKEEHYMIRRKRERDKAVTSAENIFAES